MINYLVLQTQTLGIKRGMSVCQFLFMRGMDANPTIVINVKVSVSMFGCLLLNRTKQLNEF